MPGLFDRDDWRSALSRWRDAGLIDAETENAVLTWESERESQSSVRAGRHGRVADVAAYLGVSIVVIAVLFLATALFDDGWGLYALTMVAGVVAAAASWQAVRAGSSVLSDACAGAAVFLVAIGVTLLLDEFGDDDQLWAAWLLISLVIVFAGAGMFWLTRSRLSLVAVTGGLAQAPIALAVVAGAFEDYVFDSYQDSFDSWELWTTYVLVGLVGGALLFMVGRPNRWVDEPLAAWGRLGASIGAGLAFLALAGASTSPIIDWLVLLAGLLVTARALRDGCAELLPASALLLIGALAGGMSDFDDGARLGLTIVVLLTSVELTALGWSARECWADSPSIG